MNDFVVTIAGKKRTITILDESTIEYNGEQYPINLSKINNHCYLLKVGNKVFDITSSKLERDKFGFLVNGHYFETIVRTKLSEKAAEYLKNKKLETHHDSIIAPMPGLLLKLKKKVGDKVEQGESVGVLEAMKMENDLRSPATGIIKEILVNEGSSVEKNQIIINIE